MDREEAIERLERTVEAEERSGQRARNETAQIHAAGKQIRKPWQVLPTFQRERWRNLAQPRAIAEEHHPRQRLVGIEHRMPRGKTPIAGAVVIRLGVKCRKEEAREWRMRFIHHGNYAAGHE